MSSNWCLIVIFVTFVTFEQCSCRPDFGVPAIVLDSGLVGINANLLRDSMNEVLIPIRRIPKTLHSDTLRKAGDSISKLVLNVTEVGRRLANNFSKAAIERRIPVEDLFTSLYLSFGEMGLRLTSVGPIFVTQLNEKLGNVTADEVDSALEGMNESLVDTFKAMNNLDVAMHNSLKAGSPIPAILDVPNTWSRELSKALANLRGQVRSFGKAVDGSVRSIEVANSYLNTVNTNIRTVETGFKYTLSIFNSTIDYENSSAVNKYKIAQNSFQSDFAAAIQRLKIFSSNKTLNGLSDLHTEEFTKNYYELYNRYKSDMATIHNAFNWIRSNTSNVLNETGQRFFDVVNDSASTLTSVILARERFADQCYSKFSPRITGSFPGFQTEMTSCVSRERGRISRLSDVIDRVLLLVQANSVDFSSDVGSCSRFGAFASNEADYLQAEACLEANLRETYTYNRLMNAQLDALKPILAAEVEASHFRTRQCVMQTVSEMSALLDSVKTGVLKCSVDGP